MEFETVLFGAAFLILAAISIPENEPQNAQSEPVAVSAPTEPARDAQPADKQNNKDAHDQIARAN